MLHTCCVVRALSTYRCEIATGGTPDHTRREKESYNYVVRTIFDSVLIHSLILSSISH